MTHTTKTDYLLRTTGLSNPVNSKGYMTVPAPTWYTGRLSGNVCEHIIIACKAAGITRLPSGHDVHHIDCDRLNNSPANLIIVSDSTHRKIHRQMRVLNLPTWHERACL